MPTDDVAGQTITHPTLDPDHYFLPYGYEQRAVPEYFTDDVEDGITWQPDVYPFAAQVARDHGCDVIVDLGCGRGGKLVPLHAGQPDWQYIGVDVGANISWCQENLAFGRWIEADLETCQALPIDDDVLSRAVIVCSDVLEHLVRPDVAAGLIGSLLQRGARAAVLSTPARELRAGAADPGPPRNVSHVREWASEEFRAFLTGAGLNITDFSHTRSDDAGGGMTTQLALLQAHPPVNGSQE
ncbi:class I SAM-dependent methyltransferase [Streptomyces avidinii]|uniref:class I SAM-dependent methyltransferase n=1 Tax=Streptomyces avidinii TaxID=1895 RepID=UPI0037AEEE19